MRAFALTIALTALASGAIAGVAAPKRAPEHAPLPPGSFAWPEAFRNCANIPDRPDSCAPIVACVGDRLWFKGRALGRGSGTIAGYLSNGTSCRGRWKSRNIFGLGQADVICGDEVAARVFFTYQDEATGTATGRGVTSRGEAVHVWSGHNIRAFLVQQGKGIAPQLICGGAEIPIS